MKKKKRTTFKRVVTWDEDEMCQAMAEMVGQDEMLDEELTIETFETEPVTQWWVARKDFRGDPDLEGMDGPHDAKSECEKTVQS